MGQISLTDPAATWVTAGDSVSCAACGVLFWLTSGYEKERRTNHTVFYCPNGHTLSFKGETEADKLRRQLKWAKDDAAQAKARADQAEASRRAYKGQATRLRKQVLAGECPFCGQHLRDLNRHVQRVHPSEAAEAPE